MEDSRVCIAVGGFLPHLVILQKYATMCFSVDSEELEVFPLVAARNTFLRLQERDDKRLFHSNNVF